MREAKEVPLLQKSLDQGKEMLFQYFSFSFFSSPKRYCNEEERREEKGEVKHENRIQNFPFLETKNIKYKLLHPLFGAWSLHLVHIQFTPSEQPKGFKLCISHKHEHESVTMNKNHMTWDNYVVHDVKQPQRMEGSISNETI